MKLKFKHVLIPLLLFPLAFPALAQKEKKEKQTEPDYDMKDAYGRKQGVWQQFNSWGDVINEINYKNDKRDGICKWYFVTVSGETSVSEEIQYLDGKRDGDYKKYYPTGEVMMEGTYEMGKKEGRWARYFDDSSPRWEGNFVKGKRDGEWKFYDRKGNVLSSITYKDGVDLKAAAAAEQAASEKKAAEKKKADATLKQPTTSTKKN